MTSGLFIANVFVYFGQSNTAGKVIILLLAVFSLIAWTLMIGKYSELSRLRKANLIFEDRLKASDAVTKIDPQFKGTSGLYANLAREALTAYHQSKGSPHAVSHVENALQRAVSRGCLIYENRMIMLSSIVSGAPFLGLLGTVWGVMDAFGSIAGQAGASVATLAPGVSGALMTTVAALLVAIPSVFGYNYLLTQAKLMITELENFASHLADRVEQESRLK